MNDDEDREMAQDERQATRMVTMHFSAGECVVVKMQLSH
jgi:hypothetical protein